VATNKPRGRKSRVLIADIGFVRRFALRKATDMIYRPVIYVHSLLPLPMTRTELAVQPISRTSATFRL
jgi:hypothetical protein